MCPLVSPFTRLRICHEKQLVYFYLVHLSLHRISLCTDDVYTIRWFDYLQRYLMTSQIAKFMGPTWVLSAQMGPVLAPWTLLSGVFNSRTNKGVDLMTRYGCVENYSTAFIWELRSQWIKRIGMTSYHVSRTELQGPVLVALINFSHSMNKYLHAQ